MKHRRMRWSISGANNMAKLLCRRENDELIGTIDRYTDGFVMTMEMQKVKREADVIEKNEKVLTIA